MCIFSLRDVLSVRVYALSFSSMKVRLIVCNEWTSSNLKCHICDKMEEAVRMLSSWQHNCC